MHKAADTVAGLAVGLTLLATIGGTLVGVFHALHSVIVWLDLPDWLHGTLAVCAIAAGVAAGAFAGMLGDRLINRPRMRK